jgi:heat shock protein HslJ
MKNKILTIGILALGLSLSACSNSKKTANDETANVNTSKSMLDWTGTYSGVLPCADCEGIETIITLNQDSTFAISTHYLGKDNSKFEKTGKFELNKDSNIVKIDDTAYLLGENMLLQLDKEDKKITGNLAENYKLQKVDEQLIGKTWKLFELSGLPVNLSASMKDPQMVLNIEGKTVTGNGICNRFFGTYEIQDGNMIKFSKMGSTKMACIAGAEIEAKLLDALNKVDNYSVKNDTLTLNIAKIAPLARFVAVKQ